MMDSSSHDGELIRASLDVPEQFAVVFERHYPAIDRYCVRRIGLDGHDVSSSTFVTAFRIRDRFDPTRANAAPWLYGIAGNGLRHHRRSELRRLRAYERVEPGAVSSFDIDDRIDAGAVGARLARGLRTLPTRDRDALLLFAWADLSYEQIADALVIPIGTVRSRISRARIRLRNALGEVAGFHGDAPSTVPLRGDDQ
ncbi:MAG: sigma-70 family RNA polymerase sigma factor [Acidimicrobiia bacterium]|nr:sigma-70 family RNA polymerase sigma factor [Acidimicrobiia bacterium]